MPCWLLGFDAYVTLHEWYRWEQLLNLTNLVVVQRPGAETAMPPSIARLDEVHRCDQLDEARIGQVIHLDIPMLPISSTEIRGKIAQQQPVEHLLAPAVYSYIVEHNLYAETTR